MPDDNSSVSASTGGTSASSGKSGPNVALIAAAVVIAVGVIFFFQNGDLVNVDFLIFEFQRKKLRWVVITSILIGVLGDRAFSIWWRRRRSSSAKKQK